MNILDDVHPALGYVLEEKAETDLLLLHGVSAVVEDDVEVRAVRLDERPQLLAAGLIRDARRGPVRVMGRRVFDVHAVDERGREVGLPQPERMTPENADLEQSLDLLAFRLQIDVVQFNVVVMVGALVGGMCGAQLRQGRQRTGRG